MPDDKPQFETGTVVYYVPARLLCTLDIHDDHTQLDFGQLDDGTLLTYTLGNEPDIAARLSVEGDLALILVHDDGTYELPNTEISDDEPWRVSGSDEEGWLATHPDDGFTDTPEQWPIVKPWRFATALDAIHAIASDPAEARRWGEEATV